MFYIYRMGCIDPLLGIVRSIFLVGRLLSSTAMCHLAQLATGPRYGPKALESLRESRGQRCWNFGRWKAKALEALGRGLARCRVDSGSSGGQRWSTNMVQHGPILVVIYHQIVVVLDMFLRKTWCIDMYSSQRFFTPQTWSCLVLDYWLMAWLFWFWWQRWQRWQPRILSAVGVLAWQEILNEDKKPVLHEASPAEFEEIAKETRDNQIAEGWCVCWGATVPVSLSTSAEFSTKVVACCGRILYIRYH